MLSEWQQVSSSTLDTSQYSGRSQRCCSLDDLHSSPYIQFFLSHYQSFGDCTKRTFTIGITVTIMFHSIFNSYEHLYFSSLSFNFTLWSTGTAKFTIQQVLFVFFLFFVFVFFFYYYNVWTSGRDQIIRL